MGLQAGFGNAFGFVVFGSTKPGLLEGHLQYMRDNFPREDGGNPFKILQPAPNEAVTG
jgi:hypothetical protein